ncbi:MAG TPA: iron-containing alcohol dehydrogenase [Polyangiaceae bacterium]|nr:iron-containing alcohol dehydrogenase [Polyangiaceae bacterium]
MSPAVHELPGTTQTGDHFEFSHRTQVVVGSGVWSRALAEARAFGAQVLLVSGVSSLTRLGLQPLLDAEAARLGLRLCRFVVPREPDVELADLAAALARSNAVSAVIGIGGGSTLDVAKAAAALATNPGSARDYLEGLPGPGPKPLAVPPLPVMCVPTTAGTGSEVTKNAVLQVADLQVKRSMRSELLFPHSAFIDPVLSGQAPTRVRAGTGFDALTHLIEAFCSSKASPLTDALAKDGIVRAIAALKSLAQGTVSERDAHDLALASTLGGMCLANAGLGAAHGLIAPLGGLYPNIPHGAGLACLLPATLTINAAAAQGSPRASARMLELWPLLGVNTTSEATRMLGELRAALGLPALASYAQIDVARVIKSPSGSLKTNPVPLGEAELRALLELSLSAS